MKIVVIGASGHGKVVASIAQAVGHEVLGFYDQNPVIKEHFGRKVRSLGDWPADCHFALGVGHPVHRLRLLEMLDQAKRHVATLIHPSAVIDQTVKVGVGSVVMAGAIVEADTVIDAAAIINSHATVNHDCRLAKGVHICPGANLAGEVAVGEGSCLGIGSSVIQQVKIGRWVMAGAGSVVINDVGDAVIIAGSPAVVKKNERYFKE